MCEQTEVKYLDGDVVWVKLGPCWWPGEVRDAAKVPTEIMKSLKKPPIAVVKFFDEDQYEYVKNLDHIYKYNCRKKNEFIKKGLDKHRAKNTFMDKFPEDVCRAETLTGGDPDIITNDIFAPDPKPNYSGLFGTPSPKKSPKTSGRGRPSIVTSKSAQQSPVTPLPITHPRFIGGSDHEVRILEQKTPKSTTPSTPYVCHICGFESMRLNVIVLHNRSHSNGTYVSPKQKTKRKGKKSKSFATTNSIDEDLALIRQGITFSIDDSDSEADSPGGKRKHSKGPGMSSKKPKVSNICNTLLADWDDGDSIDEPSGLPSKSIRKELLDDWKNSDEEETSKSSAKTTGKPSCFDFNEDEDSEILEKSPGRKIPRVIPQKRLSNDKEVEEEFRSILNETSVPSLPEIPDKNSKSTEENSEKTNGILKSDAPPNEPEPKVLEVPVIPKKRIRNFEEFEILLNEQKQAEEDAVKSKSSLEVSKLKSQLMTKLNEVPSIEDDVLKSESQPEIKKKIFAKQASEIEIVEIIPQSEPKSTDVEKNVHEEVRTKTPEEVEETVREELPILMEADKFNEKLNEETNSRDYFLGEHPEVTGSLPPESELKKSGSDKRKLKDTILTESKVVKALLDESKVADSVSDEPKVIEKASEELIIAEPDLEQRQELQIDSGVLQNVETEIKVTDLEETKVSETVEDAENILKELEPTEAISDDMRESLTEEMEDLEKFHDCPEDTTIAPKKSEVIATIPEVQEVDVITSKDQQVTTATPKVSDVEPISNVLDVVEPIPEVSDIVEPVPEVSDILQPIPEVSTVVVPVSEVSDVVEPIPEVSNIVEPLQDVSNFVNSVPEVSEVVEPYSNVPAVSEPVLEVLNPNLMESEEIERFRKEQSLEQVMTEEFITKVKETVEPSLGTNLEKEEKLEDLKPQVEETVSVPSKMLVDISDICIDNSDNLSGLSTLAAVSELTGNLYEKMESEPVVLEPPHEEPLIQELQPEVSAIETTTIEEIPPKVVEEEQIDEKPVAQTLMSFSMDFSDSNSESTIIKTVTDDKEDTSFQKNMDVDLEDEIDKLTKNEKINNFPEITVHLNEPRSTLLKAVPETTLESEMAKLTDTHPGMENVLEEQYQNTSSSKLLEILTDSRQSVSNLEDAQQKISAQKIRMVMSADSKKFDPKTSKFIIKSNIKSAISGKSNKPIILSEKIIKPVTETDSVSVKKVTSKRNYQDVEDIDTFIIQKPTKKLNLTEEAQDIILTSKTEVQKARGGSRARGKAKIIEQTIIKAADVPPVQASTESMDDSIFDINSMPIVLSDQILTPESIESLPVVMAELPVEKSSQPLIKRSGSIQQVKLLNKAKPIINQPDTSKVNQNILMKNVMPRGLAKNQKVYQAGGTKLLKNNPAVITQPGKPGKFIILPSSTSTTSPGSKYTVGKRLQTIKNVPTSLSQTVSKVKGVQNVTGEPSGNKIMIVTNQQGVQSRVLLTPAQQKLLGCKMPAKLTKPATKVVPKSILTTKGTILTSSSQTIVTSKGQMFAPGSQLVMPEGQVLTPLTQQQLKALKTEQKSIQQKKMQVSPRLVLTDKSTETKGKLNLIGSKTKTILIKGSQGQTLKKIQAPIGDSTTNLLLSQPGQKSQFVSLSSSQPQTSPKHVMITTKATTKPDVTVCIQKPVERQKLTPLKPAHRLSPKTAIKTQILDKKASNITLPPLAPITTTQSKKETPVTKPLVEEKTPEKSTSTEQKQLNQLIIQDTLGNQTTVTEGQILALPSGETVDGQSQSYVLVTVDETGNLIPISNDTLMSLDPNLANSGGDLNNLVIQIDPGATQENLIVQPQETKSVQPLAPQMTEADIVTTESQLVPTSQDTSVSQVEKAVLSGAETGQQLIITGDPESTQKFLASLSEGHTDLSSLLSGAEGNIIINADGQQILLNTDSDNQILLSVNSDNLGLIQTSSENDSVYGNQLKNQDILAAALADTDVFQPEQSVDKTVTKAQLSPNSGLYPMNVGNVLETSLTSVGLGSPIMTPLEVPSVPQKKIASDESALLTQVPSSLELPITITDPSISQTVSQQVMLGNELQSNLELPITSSSFVYSLPTLDEHTDLEQKSVETVTTSSDNYSAITEPMSMPLLTEEPEVAESEPVADNAEEVVPNSARVEKPANELQIGTIEEELDLAQADLCSSLSEPPPGMFDKGGFASILDDKGVSELSLDSTENPGESTDLPMLPNVREEKSLQDSNMDLEYEVINTESTPSNIDSPQMDLDENSSEIPIQPQIVTSLDDNVETKQNDDSMNGTNCD